MYHTPTVTACALLLAGFAYAQQPAAAQTPDAQACAREGDDAKRLACYDSVFRGAPSPTAAGSTPAQETAPVAPSPGSESRAAPSPIRNDASNTEPHDLVLSSLATKAWELTPESKRGTFVVRTYQPNFVLPFHWSSNINQAPQSPTRGTSSPGVHYQPVESKIQISLRAKVFEDLLLPDADLWFAYTQRSLWQVWNTKESSPFRSTDYQPEALYVIPIPKAIGRLPFGWTWRMSQLGLMHQSNGQSDPLSRSWNNINASATFDRGDYGFTARFYRRLHENAANDDNPDLVHFIGNAEFSAAWVPGLATTQFTWRTQLGSPGRGSYQLNWSYPVDLRRPTGLRWYVQLFSGYGETLLDYNHQQNSLGVGVTLFQF